MGRPGALGPCDTGARDPDLLDEVELIGGVAHHHVGKARSQTAPGGDGDPCVDRGGIELNHLEQSVGIVAGQGHRNPRRDGLFHHRKLSSPRRRHRHRIEVVGQISGGIDVHRCATLDRSRHHLRPFGVDVVDEDVGDPGALGELSRGTRADGTGADEENPTHRKSGASSSRHPPLVGGTPPRPRSRTKPAASTATAATMRPRRNAFMKPGVYGGGVPGSAAGHRFGGARWTRTTDLTLIRGAL